MSANKRGPHAGADDFINNRLRLGKLLARLRAALRGHRKASPDDFRTGDIKVKPGQRRVLIAGNEVHLTRSSTSWFKFSSSCRPSGDACQLLKEVWGQIYEDQIITLRVYMLQLRESWKRICASTVFAHRAWYRLSTADGTLS